MDCWGESVTFVLTLGRNWGCGLGPAAPPPTAGVKQPVAADGNKKNEKQKNKMSPRKTETKGK